MLTKNQINDCFKANIHCSQIVLGEFAEELGYDREGIIALLKEDE